MKLLMHKHNNHSGFTMLELSIVLVIVGLLVSLGTNLIGPLTTFVKSKETREMQEATLQSIVSWVSSNNTLPNESGFLTVAKAPLDAWGQKQIYLYDSGLYSATPTKDTICGRNTTNLKLFSSYSSNIAFAVFSRADNSAFKSRLIGTYNSAPINGVITLSGAATGSITVTGLNGDLVRWVTLDELRSKIGCQGAPLKIVNNELPFGNYSVNYSATVVADGGNGAANYQWRIKKGSFPAGVTSSVLPFANSSTTEWASATSLNMNGYPKEAGSYYFTIFVRDTIGNSSSKLFVVTVNP
jgi:prepilin-type N-terminal cleavage/methylation domain-containing protein